MLGPGPGTPSPASAKAQGPGPWVGAGLQPLPQHWEPRGEWWECRPGGLGAAEPGSGICRGIWEAQETEQRAKPASGPRADPGGGGRVGRRIFSGAEPHAGRVWFHSRDTKLATARPRSYPRGRGHGPGPGRLPTPHSLQEPMRLMQAAGVGGRGCVVASWRPQAPDTASPGPAPRTAAPGRQQAPGGLHRPGPRPAPCCGGRTEVRGAAGLAHRPCRLPGRRSAFGFPPLQWVTASFPPTSQGGRGHTPRMVTVPWCPLGQGLQAGRPPTAPEAPGGPGPPSFLPPFRLSHPFTPAWPSPGARDPSALLEASSSP